jgi:hypothetical protein
MTIARLAGAGAVCACASAVALPGALSPELTNRMLSGGLEVRALQLGWWAEQQSLELAWPERGLHSATVRVDAGLLRLCLGSVVQGAVRVQGRGALVSATGSARLLLEGGALLGRLDRPATATIEVESTAEASAEALEEIAAIHPWLADVLMASGADELKGSAVIVDAGSELQLLPRSGLSVVKAVSASGTITARAPHPMTMEFAGAWVGELLLSLVSAGLIEGGGGGGSTGGNKLAVRLDELRVSHSALRWSVADGVVRFARSDMQLNQALRLATWGSYDLTSRQVDCRLGLPAETLRRMLSR